MAKGNLQVRVCHYLFQRETRLHNFQMLHRIMKIFCCPDIQLTGIGNEAPYMIFNQLHIHGIDTGMKVFNAFLIIFSLNLVHLFTIMQQKPEQFVHDRICTALTRCSFFLPNAAKINLNANS
jgi:hypothetical protein